MPAPKAISLEGAPAASDARDALTAARAVAKGRDAVPAPASEPATST